MIEYERIISDLEQCLDDSVVAVVPADTVEEVIALLKAKEPVELLIGGDADGMHGNWWYICGHCHEPIDRWDKYCRCCGRGVKWE